MLLCGPTNWCPILSQRERKRDDGRMNTAFMKIMSLKNVFN